jgi:hypothetical protein
MAHVIPLHGSQASQDQRRPNLETSWKHWPSASGIGYRWIPFWPLLGVCTSGYMKKIDLFVYVAHNDNGPTPNQYFFFFGEVGKVSCSFKTSPNVMSKGFYFFSRDSLHCGLWNNPGILLHISLLVILTLFLGSYAWKHLRLDWWQLSWLYACDRFGLLLMQRDVLLIHGAGYPGIQLESGYGAMPHIFGFWTSFTLTWIWCCEPCILLKYICPQLSK